MHFTALMYPWSWGGATLNASGFHPPQICFIKLVHFKCAACLAQKAPPSFLYTVHLLHLPAARSLTLLFFLGQWCCCFFTVTLKIVNHPYFSLLSPTVQSPDSSLLRWAPHSMPALWSWPGTPQIPPTATHSPTHFSGTWSQSIPATASFRSVSQFSSIFISCF